MRIAMELQTDKQRERERERERERKRERGTCRYETSRGSEGKSGVREGGRGEVGDDERGGRATSG